MLCDYNNHDKKSTKKGIFLTIMRNRQKGISRLKRVMKQRQLKTIKMKKLNKTNQTEYRNRLKKIIPKIAMPSVQIIPNNHKRWIECSFDTM